MNPGKKIVSAFIEATNNRDWEKFDSLVADDFIRHSSLAAKKIDSKEKLLAFQKAELLSFPDIQETILFLAEEGDIVAARLRFKGTQLGPFPASGRQLQADFNCFFRMVDGKIKESWVAYDSLDDLIQLGHYHFPATKSVHLVISNL